MSQVRWTPSPPRAILITNEWDGPSQPTGPLDKLIYLTHMREIGRTRVPSKECARNLHGSAHAIAPCDPRTCIGPKPLCNLQFAFCLQQAHHLLPVLTRNALAGFARKLTRGVPSPASLRGDLLGGPNWSGLGAVTALEKRSELGYAPFDTANCWLPTVSPETEDKCLILRSDPFDAFLLFFVSENRTHTPQRLAP